MTEGNIGKHILSVNQSQFVPVPPVLTVLKVLFDSFSVPAQGATAAGGFRKRNTYRMPSQAGDATLSPVISWKGTTS